MGKACCVLGLQHTEFKHAWVCNGRNHKNGNTTSLLTWNKKQESVFYSLLLLSFGQMSRSVLDQTQLLASLWPFSSFLSLSQHILFLNAKTCAQYLWSDCCEVKQREPFMWTFCVVIISIISVAQKHTCTHTHTRTHAPTHTHTSARARAVDSVYFILAEPRNSGAGSSLLSVSH